MRILWDKSRLTLDRGPHLWGTGPQHDTARPFARDTPPRCLGGLHPLLFSLVAPRPDFSLHVCQWDSLGCNDRRENDVTLIFSNMKRQIDAIGIKKKKQYKTKPDGHRRPCLAADERYRIENARLRWTVNEKCLLSFATNYPERSAFRTEILTPLT